MLRHRAHYKDCATCGNSPTSRNTSPYMAKQSRLTRTSTWRYASFAPHASVHVPNTILMDQALIEMQELESESLKPGPSEKLAQIGLALLKHVSSHKGLTYAAYIIHVFSPLIKFADRPSSTSTHAANSLPKHPNVIPLGKTRSPTSSTTSTSLPRFASCNNSPHGP